MHTSAKADHNHRQQAPPRDIWVRTTELLRSTRTSRLSYIEIFRNVNNEHMHVDYDQYDPKLSGCFVCHCTGRYEKS